MAGRAVRSGALGVICLLGASLLPGPARGEGIINVFDPVLSLTGSCVVSEEDPVPDPAEPACPAANIGLHPEVPFNEPRGVATDSYGDIYVPNNSGGHGYIDVFDSNGFFIAEIAEGLTGVFVKDIAVDRQGYLYVYAGKPEAVVLRLDPGPGNDPSNGIISYEDPVTVLTGVDGLSETDSSIAVDASGHLFVTMEPGFNSHINEYGSAGEGNEPIDATIGKGVLARSRWVTVDSRNGDIYASNRPEGQPSSVKVFSGEANHPLKRTISGFSIVGDVTPAVDEGSGQVVVADLGIRKKIYVFEASEQNQTASEAISIIEKDFEPPFPAPRIVVDNGPNSPNAGYLFVPSLASESSLPDHVYAFKPVEPPGTPKIESAALSEISETEATLEAVVNPENAATHYSLEYVTEEAYEAGGFAGATLVEEGEIPVGDLGVPVSASISGLQPGTEYRALVVAENCSPDEPERECRDEREVGFTTYASVRPFPACPNDSLRGGPSAHLPDCRAYELVTPSGTGGRSPSTVGISPSGLFATPVASPGGDSFSFLVSAGGIPGFDGAGGFLGDGYVSERQAYGWQTQLKGPSGAQMAQPAPGGLSPDHGFAAWATNSDSGELVIEVGDQYIMYPDGSFHLAGRGSFGVSPRSDLKRITAAGGHMIFSALTQLESKAPKSGTRAIYDRTIDGITGAEETHVVSLLPDNKTPEEGGDATYLGSTGDGNTIAFKVGTAATSPLYLRVDNTETLIATAAPGAEFADLSQSGRYLFYVQGGDLYRFDAQSKSTDRITESGDALFVNVSADGSHAYFVSPSVLTGSEQNSQGDRAIEGQEGEQNLYAWNGETVTFVATITERDIIGEFSGNIWLDGLGLWTPAMQTGRVAIDPSRTSVDGNVFLFESRASLTGYDSEGEAEIYRFDASTGELRCLSCNPTGSPATSAASLYSLGDAFEGDPVKPYAWIPNLSLDGRRAFFESSEPLVVRDTDNTQDVYEWEEDGVGSCNEPGGCVYLISSGQSARPNYLFGASDSGGDVFVLTSDLLTGGDDDETPSVYDARVEGGFPEGVAPICEGEACRPPVTPPPSLSSSESAPRGRESHPPKHVCRRGKRPARHHRGNRCGKRHKSKRGRHRSRGGRG